MPVETKPEDKPARVCFHRDGKEGQLAVTCQLLEGQEAAPYRVEGGVARFDGMTAFKAKAVEVGMSPAVAEDASRSFNATARQLRELGFQVAVSEED